MIYPLSIAVSPALARGSPCGYSKTMKNDCRRGAIALLGAAVIAAGLTVSCVPRGDAARSSGSPAASGPGPLDSAPRRIVSMAPAYTAILVDLGLASSLAACDTWSPREEGMAEDLPRFDMMRPDAERLAALEPDLVLVSEMTKQGTSADPFKPLSDSGIRVEYIPTSSSIEDIRRDTRRIAALAGASARGEELLAAMDKAIEEIRAVARTIPENTRRTALFEISPAPYIYSFGRGVYLHELLEAAGVKNALASEEGWISVSSEAAVASNPDVILTNADFGSDPVKEILSRPGWEGISAVRTHRVFYIDNDSSSQPGPRIVKALGEIAKAVYPEYFR